MAKALQFELKGLAEMESQLKELNNDTFKKRVLNSAYRKAVTPFVKTARANAPVHPTEATLKGGVKVKSGNLRRSITKWKIRGYRAPHIVVGARIGKKRKYDGWYYHFVEFGTKYQAANPFLQRSWSQSKGAIEKNLETEFNGILKKFKNKYGIK